jgi:hypothetical protein
MLFIYDDLQTRMQAQQAIEGQLARMNASVLG